MAHRYLKKINGKITIRDLADQFGFVSSSKFIAYYKRYFKETPKDTAIRMRHMITLNGVRKSGVVSTKIVFAAE